VLLFLGLVLLLLLCNTHVIRHPTTHPLELRYSHTQTHTHSVDSSFVRVAVRDSVAYDDVTRNSRKAVAHSSSSFSSSLYTLREKGTFVRSGKKEKERKRITRKEEEEEEVGIFIITSLLGE